MESNGINHPQKRPVAMQYVHVDSHAPFNKIPLMTRLLVILHEKAQQ